MVSMLMIGVGVGGEKKGDDPALFIEARHWCNYMYQSLGLNNHSKM